MLSPLDEPVAEVPAVREVSVFGLPVEWINGKAHEVFDIDDPAQWF
ncbi:hypothetical protein ACFXG4_25780 [Nocardia sp. NPDC059246]